MVASGQLSLLLTRLQGVKAVTNPEAASGGQDPEQLADARNNAPRTVLTLDRAVSLQDYTDFAGSFAGIGKALATWTWNGRERGVFLTVAGPDGAPLNPGDSTLLNLLTALQNVGDPFVSLQVKSYIGVGFNFDAAVKISADFDADAVLAAVARQLSIRFSFYARAFGQPVMLSEFIAVIQSVPGVAAVNVDQFYRRYLDNYLPGLEQILTASLPIMYKGVLRPAELLTLTSELIMDSLRIMS